MSVSREDFADKTLSGREATSNAKRLIEEIGASTLTLHAQDVYGEIFDVNPTTELAKPIPKIEQRTLFVLTSDVSVPSNQAWKAGLADWIPPQFGPLYEAAFFDGSDASIGIPEQITRGFRFNYKTGILTLDDASGLVLPIKVTAFRYIGARATDLFGPGGGGGGAVDDSGITGGMRTVVDISARDSIPVGERKIGMRVHVQSVDGGFRLASDLTTWTPEGGLGSYRVVATIAARDAIDASLRFQGLRVRVLSLPYTYELISGLVEWRLIPELTQPNTTQAFFDVADATIVAPNTGGFDGIYRFIDPSNISGTASDENDGESPTTPWLTGQRAFDEIPDDPRLGTGPFGGSFIYFVVMSDGFTPPVKLEFNKLGGAVFVLVVANLDVLTPTESFGAPGAGVNPVAVGTNFGGVTTIDGQFSYAGLGAFTQPGDGTHFLAAKNNFGSPTFNQYDTFTIDGTLTDGPGGDLRVISRFAPVDFDTDVRMYPFATTFGNNVPGIFGGILSLVNKGRTPLGLFYQGLQTQPNDGTPSGTFRVSVDGSDMSGCLIRGAILDVVENAFGGFVTGGPAMKPEFSIAFRGAKDVEGNGNISVLRGLVLTAPNCTGLVTCDSLMIRCPDVSSAMIHFGGLTGDPENFTNVSFDRTAFDGLGSEGGFQARRNTTIRIASSLLFIEVARAFLIQDGTTILNGDMRGSQNTPSLVRRGSRTLAQAGIRALTDGLQNRSVTGANVLIGADTTPYDFSTVDLPKVDLPPNVASVDLSELCSVA